MPPSLSLFKSHLLFSLSIIKFVHSLSLSLSLLAFIADMPYNFPNYNSTFLFFLCHHIINLSCFQEILIKFHSSIIHTNHLYHNSLKNGIWVKVVLSPMEAKDKSSSNFHPPSNCDEIFMRRTLLFADSLKDLRNIRNQLYEAAEFFEDSYHRNDHDQLLLESLKDYVSKAVISTIDHLGSVTSKVDTFLNENVDEVFETNLRVLCIEQRLRTCQTYSDHEGLRQQSLVIQIPKYQKQYYLSDGRFSEAVKAEKVKTETSGLRRGHTQQASVDFPSDFVAFSFTKPASNKGSEKRSRSISPSRFRIKRSGSAANQFSSPSFPVVRSGSAIHQSISPKTRQQNPAEGWRSHLSYPEREKRKDIEVYSKKTKNLFKALLSIHKYKNDTGPPYR